MLARMLNKGKTSLLIGLQTFTVTMEINMAVPQNLEIDLPQDTTILLLGIYPKDAPSYHKDTY